MVKVSIIMPVYNVENYIETAIVSILNQTFLDFELIIVNDGTKDHSIEIAENFKSKDERIVILNKENGGLSDARNAGLEKATGKFILFIDSDDEIENNLLELTIKTAELSNLDLVIFGYYKDNIDENGKTFKSQKKKHRRNQNDEVVVDLELLDIIGYAWNKLYRRDFLISNRVKFIKGLSLIEDIVFNNEVFKKTNNFLFLDECLYHYKQRDRITLISAFRTNEYQLQKKSLVCRESILEHWKVDQRIIKKCIAELHVIIIKSTIAKFFLKNNNVTLLDKYKYIKNLTKENIVQDRIENYVPKSMQDNIYKILIKRRMNIVLLILHMIRGLKR